MIELAPLIVKASSRYNIDPKILASLVHQESEGIADAERFEPTFYRTKMKWRGPSDLAGFVPPSCFPNDKRTQEEWLTFEHIQRSTSYGLCQIMGETARWALQVQGVYIRQHLCDAAINLELGAKYLRRILDGFKKLPDEKAYWFALKQYNGSPSYADKVLSHVKNETYAYLLPPDFLH